jgi:hypothetical protein
LAAAAAVNRYLANKAERDNPPVGRFLDVNGVAASLRRTWHGDAVVLLHGNGSMIQISNPGGLIDLAAKDFRVVVFDRPASTQRASRAHCVDARSQAELIKALTHLGVSRAIILGHSWGASVAVAMGLKYPDLVRGLFWHRNITIPRSGPCGRDGAPALPIVGDFLSQTISPLLSRAIWPLMLKKIFGPKSVPTKFQAFRRRWRCGHRR